jgi:adenosylmethionine-8-amino-7-oxononanoate aminotransferase
MIEKIYEQMQVLDHSIFAGSTHPKAVEAAEKIVNNVPGNFAKAFFSDNGSTAVEVGLKMVYQYWFNKGIDKKRFLALEGAYHGDTFGAMSVGQRGYFNKPFEALFFDVDYLPFPTEENIEEVLKQANELMATGEFAGFIFEPLVQGAAGMRIYKAEWLEKLLKIARENEVLTIADEVMTGFYRTGTLFAIGQVNESVDIVAMSKGLTGGVMAMGMTVTTQKVFDAFLSEDIGKAFLHGHSFTANPIACSAVCASMDLLLPVETKMKVESISMRHKEFCNRIKNHSKFRSAKTQGTILSLEIEVGEESSYFSSIRTDAYNYFLEHEILIRPLGNVIYVNPPYCITDEQLDYIHEHILTFVENWRPIDSN